jgi:hypothetical protein
MLISLYTEDVDRHFVKLRRNIMQHRQGGDLSVNGYNILLNLILLASAKTGNAKFAASDMAAFLELTIDQVYWAMWELFEEGYLIKLKGGGHKTEVYEVQVSNYEKTAGDKSHTLQRLVVKSRYTGKSRKSRQKSTKAAQAKYMEESASNTGMASDLISAESCSYEHDDMSRTGEAQGVVPAANSTDAAEVRTYQEDKNSILQEGGEGEGGTGQPHQVGPTVAFDGPPPRNPRKSSATTYSPAPQAHTPPAAETPATPVSESSDIVYLLLDEFLRHMPNHTTFCTPRLYANQPEKLEPLASEPKAPAVLHWIFNSADAFFWRDALIKANWPTSLFVSSWETILKQFEEKTSGTKQKPAKTSAPSVVPSGPRVEERVPFGNPLTLDEIDKILAE